MSSKYMQSWICHDSAAMYIDAHTCKYFRCIKGRSDHQLNKTIIIIITVYNQFKERFCRKGKTKLHSCFKSLMASSYIILKNLYNLSYYNIRGIKKKITNNYT